MILFTLAMEYFPFCLRLCFFVISYCVCLGFFHRHPVIPVVSIFPNVYIIGGIIALTWYMLI